MLMRKKAVVLACTLLCSALAGLVLAAEPGTPVLKLNSSVELPGYTGDFDHFAVDVKGRRLFLAAEDHGTLEVFDLVTGKHLKTVAGVDAPHGILYLADAHRLVVTDSGAGFSKVFDAVSYKPIGAIKLTPGADSLGYDSATKQMYVVTGGKNGELPDSTLVKLDPRTGKQTAAHTFDTDKVEAMAIEQKGKLLYINITGKNEVAVLDKASLAVVKVWPVTEGKMNAAMAFDESNARLFVVTRKPYQLLVLDTKTGATVATFPAPERTNEAIFDQVNRRIYLAGDDVIGVIQQHDADHYEALPAVASAHGAKTAIHVPQLGRLYAAVSPGEGKTGAAVLRFDVVPAAGAGK